jgi:hypothetical protein
MRECFKMDHDFFFYLFNGLMIFLAFGGVPLSTVYR